MADRSQKALSEFVSEAQETIDALGSDLMRLAGAGTEPDPDLLNAVFRAAHSLKGLSSMHGLERMARLAHALEDLLDDVRLGRRPLARDGLDLLLEAPEVFSRIIAEEASGSPPATTDAATRLTDRLRAGHVPDRSTTGDPLATLGLGPEIRGVLTEYEEHRLRTAVSKGRALFKIRVTFDLASFDRELATLSIRLKRVGEVVSTLPSSDPADPGVIAFQLLFATSEAADAVARVAGAGATLEAVASGAAVGAPGPARTPAPISLSPAPASPDAEGASLKSASQSVRVDIRKLDRLMNVVGELVLVKSGLLGLAERLKADPGDPALAAELQRANRALERKLGELQSGILEVRMIPLEGVFDKLARMVRRIAREVGKEIELEVSGGEVELDKLIVEELADPLMHLIRNAVDHAVEAPDVRERQGKPRAGRISLRAIQRGHHVQLVIADDGHGIDEARVREVAIARGLASAESLGDLSHRDLMNLIFAPGFSTAKEVTALSGRGVGLDVVKNNVAKLSGIIDLHSERGNGTRFELTLPVTLAIVRALVVRTAARTYAVPLNSVLEILEVKDADVRTLSSREVITVRGATLPLVRLARFFALSGDAPPPTFFVVVVGLAQERLGIAVDGVLGQQDVVVKPLGAALAGVRGIAGATDLGSGRTVLVLDVGAILEEVVTGERRDAAGSPGAGLGTGVPAR